MIFLWCNDWLHVGLGGPVGKLWLIVQSQSRRRSTVRLSQPLSRFGLCLFRRGFGHLAPLEGSLFTNHRKRKTHQTSTDGNCISLGSVYRGHGFCKADLDCDCWGAMEKGSTENRVAKKLNWNWKPEPSELFYQASKIFKNRISKRDNAFLEPSCTAIRRALSPEEPSEPKSGSRKRGAGKGGGNLHDCLGGVDRWQWFGILKSLAWVIWILDASAAT